MFTLLKFPYLICFFSAITKSHISQVKCKGVKDTAILIFNRILSTWAGCSHAKCKVNRFILSKVNPPSVKTLTEGHSLSVLKLSPKPEYVFNQSTLHFFIYSLANDTCPSLWKKRVQKSCYLPAYMPDTM